MESTANLFQSSGYWIINKRLDLALGTNTVKFLMEIVFIWDTHKHNKENPGWAYKTREALQENTGISISNQQKFAGILSNIGLIETRVFGGRIKKLHYKVNEENVRAYIENLNNQSIEDIKKANPQRFKLNHCEGEHPTENIKNINSQMLKNNTCEASTGVKNKHAISNNIKSINNKEVCTKVQTCLLGRKRRTLGSMEGKRLRFRKDLKINKLVSTKKLAEKENLAPIALDILTHWNSKPNLPTHNISPNDEGKLTKFAKDCQRIIFRLIQGTHYTNCPDLPPPLQNKKFTIDKIKLAIDRANTSSSADYYNGGKKLRFNTFIHNQYSKLIDDKGSRKYKYKYPFLYFISYDPIPHTEAHRTKVSKYKPLIDRTVGMLRGEVTGRQYNMVVRQFEKAVALVTEKANGNAQHLIYQLPDLIYESLVEVNKGLTVEAFPLGVYNLTAMMRKRLIIA